MTMDDYGVLTAPDTLRIERELPGPIERVWDYLTDSDKRGTWLASGAMEPRVGGAVEHVFRNSQLTRDDDAPPKKYEKYACESTLRGRITAYEPPRRLSYLWGESSEVTFELEPRGNRVRLVVTHQRLGSRDEILSVSGGWHAHLEILAARLAGTEPPGFWRTHTKLEAEYAKRIPAH
jgi:uncharacterized protein YndB with AHSA1/START domain